ncbi:MAG: hypothetical protein QOE37_1583, partial [Microbacteriaceae bacterium]|nr:hypothetical protein [Microbacteriaceae bacterium]
MTTSTTAPGRRLGRRSGRTDGPRARLTDLLPYFREHR